jgi:hypothetical protein
MPVVQRNESPVRRTRCGGAAYGITRQMRDHLVRVPGAALHGTTSAFTRAMAE